MEDKKLNPGTIYAEIGSRVRKARLKQRMTQEALANKVHLERTSVTNIEKGRQKLPIHTLYEVASALAVPPTDLLPPPSDKKNPILEELAVHPKPTREWIESLAKQKADSHASKT